jgi:hypothetical protein
MLDRTGDTTLIWDESSDAAVLPVIEKKLAEGVVFFLLEPVAGGLAPPRRVPLQDVAEVRERRALAMADKDFAALVGIGDVTVVKTDNETAEAPRKRQGRIAHNAQEIVASPATVAVRPARGG